MKRLYVANLTYQATEDTTRSLFEAYGTVSRVNIVTDRDTGQPRGFAFVEMANDGEAEKAMAGLNGKDFNGRLLAVNEARPKPDLPSGGGGDRRPDRRDRFTRDAPKTFPKRQILT